MGEPGSWRNPHEQNEPAGWGAAPPPLVGERRGRPGLIALIVALVELVVIAAACNQSVTKHEIRYAGEHRTFLGDAVGSLLTFSWRVSPTSSDNRDGYHFLWSQLITIGVFVVLSALLTLVVVRGPVTFWRAFFAIWTAVLATACVGRAVGSAFTKSPLDSFDRGTYAVFAAVNGGVVFIGAVIGLVAALIAAVLAVATRRTVAAEPSFLAPEPNAAPPVAETPPPFYGNAPSTDYRQPPSDPRADGATTAFPVTSDDRPGGSPTERYPDASGHPNGQHDDQQDGGRHEGTTQLPRFDPRGGQSWTPPQRDGDEGGGATQAFPAPGDDQPRR